MEGQETYNPPANLYEAVNGAPAKPNTGGQSDKARRIALQEHQSFEYARDRHEKYITSADKHERYYEGDQWDPKDIQKLQAEGRPALTINKVLSTVNTIIGEQVTRRVDIKFKSKHPGADDAARARSKLAMAITDANDYDFKESAVFQDGVIMDRGYFDFRISFDNNPAGEVEIDRLDPRMVIPDPDFQHYDPKKWREVTIMEWMSIDDLKLAYGKEKAEQVEKVAMQPQGAKLSPKNFQYSLPGGKGPEDEGGTITEDDLKKSLKAVLVRQRQFWKHTRVFCLADPVTGETRTLPHQTTQEEASIIGEQMGYPVFSKIQKRVRWRAVVDNVLLYDDWSPYQTFTVIPYFCYFRPGKPFGAVTNLISPQEQLNKLNSQELHIVNSTANSGWVVPKGGLTNMSIDDLEKDGSKTGLVVEYNPTKGAPDKIKANTIPTGIDRISLKAEAHIKEISGITDALLGLESAEVSGVALQSKEKRGQVQIQGPLDNLTYTRKLVGRKVLELMRDYYTDTRIVAINNDDQPGQPREFMAINEPQADGSIQNDISFGEDDVVISTVPSRDLFEDNQFAQLLDMRNVGIQVPDYRIIMNSQLQHKQEIAEESKAMAGLTPPSEEEMERAAIQEQLQMMGQQLELQKIQAEIQELESRAAHQMAKAQTEVGTDDRTMADIESKLAIKREEFKLRERLAALSQLGKLDSVRAQGVENQRAAVLNSALDAMQPDKPRGDTKNG